MTAKSSTLNLVEWIVGDDRAYRMEDASAVAAAAAAAAATPWHRAVAGADAEIIGHLETKGWHTKAPAEAAFEAARSHLNAERLLGMRSDHDMLPIPKDPAKGDMSKVWERLGTPKDAKDYDFSTVKRADGSALDDSLAGYLREQALAMHMPKDMAARMAQTFAKRMDDTAAAAAAEKAAALVGEKTKLDANWGANKEANMFVAKQTAGKLGVTPEEVQALENTIGYARTLEMFRMIGSKTGEDTFVTGDRPAGKGVMTRDQAVARKAELMADQGWSKRYTDGGMNSAEFREMQGLLTLIVGDDTEASRRR